MPVNLRWLKSHFRRRQYTVADHAVDEMFDEEIDTAQLEEAVDGRIRVLEDYEQRGRKRALVAGSTTRRASLYWQERRRPLHIVIGYGGSWPRVVTVYEPHPSTWETPYRRRGRRRRDRR